MCDPDPVDPSAICWSRLTVEQRDQLVRLVIAQAHIARARAIRDLLRMLLSPALRGAAAVAATWRAIAKWRARRRAIRELGAFDDRTLRDMGLNRAGIEAAVEGRGPARATGLSVPSDMGKPRASGREETTADAAPAG